MQRKHHKHNYDLFPMLSRMCARHMLDTFSLRHCWKPDIDISCERHEPTITVYKPSPGMDFYSMFTVWHRCFIWYWRFRAENWSSAPFTVQGKCMYIFLKRITRKFNFRSYVLNLVKINKFVFFQRLVVLGLIYRPAVTSMYY